MSKKTFEEIKSFKPEIIDDIPMYLPKIIDFIKHKKRKKKKYYLPLSSKDLDTFLLIDIWSMLNMLIKSLKESEKGNDESQTSNNQSNNV